jgi:hypothetical protein
VKIKELFAQPESLVLELGHVDNVFNDRTHVNDLIVESFEVDADLLLILFADGHLNDFVVALHAVEG